jgi:hypothetical protein
MVWNEKMSPRYRKPFPSESDKQFRYDKSHEIASGRISNEIAEIITRIDALEKTTYAPITSGIIPSAPIPMVQVYVKRFGTAATDWSCRHMLGTKYVVVQCYNDDGTNVTQFLPDSIIVTDVNNLSITVSPATAGVLIVFGVNANAILST